MLPLGPPVFELASYVPASCHLHWILLMDLLIKQLLKSTLLHIAGWLTQGSGNWGKGRSYPLTCRRIAGERDLPVSQTNRFYPVVAGQSSGPAGYRVLQEPRGKQPDRHSMSPDHRSGILSKREVLQ